jgi:hypothetical protein
MVGDRDNALDALGGPHQPLGVIPRGDLAGERTDAVAYVDLHVASDQHLVDDLGADGLVVAQEHGQHVRSGDDAQDAARRVADRHPPQVALHHQARRGGHGRRRRHRLDERRHERGRGRGTRFRFRLVPADVAGPPSIGRGVRTGGGGHQVGLGDHPHEHARRVDDRNRAHACAVQEARQLGERRVRRCRDDIGGHDFGDHGAEHGKPYDRTAVAVDGAGSTVARPMTFIAYSTSWSFLLVALRVNRVALRAVPARAEVTSRPAGGP